VKIDVRLSCLDPLEVMTRIRNVILICESTPKGVFAWLDYARPIAVFDADLQRIFGIVDAAVMTIRHNLNDGYDFHAALARVNAICKSRIGEVN
jgi:hypothetical protein